MMGIILDLLQLDDWHNISEEIEIAKGKNKIPMTFNQGLKQLKRQRKWQSRRL